MQRQAVVDKILSCNKVNRSLFNIFLLKEKKRYFPTTFILYQVKDKVWFLTGIIVAGGMLQSTLHKLYNNNN
jgi:hypothetical protein